MLKVVLNAAPDYLIEFFRVFRKHTFAADH